MRTRLAQWKLGLDLAVAVLVLPLALGYTPVAFAKTIALANTSTVGARPGQCPGGVLLPHSPIHIATDTDWTAANGVSSGSGTVADPFVISCLSISVTDPNGSGILINSAAQDKSVAIHDVSLAPTGPSGGNGISLAGSNSASAGSIAVENVTATGFGGNGIHAASIATPIRIASNLLENSGQGVAVTGAPQIVITQNQGLNNTTCIQVSGSRFVATNNTCMGGAVGLNLNGTIDSDVSGNDIEGATTGVRLASAHVHDNIVRLNGTGFSSAGSPWVVENNLIELNRGAGIDITVAQSSTIRNNTILNNGTDAIQSFAFGFATPSSFNLIDGNHIGGSPFGIVLEFGASFNSVQNTDWTDGHPSYIRFGNTNTVVDAGSAQHGVVNTPTGFHDWIAQVEAGSVGPNSTDTVSAVTGGTFDFGDGSSQSLTPADLTNVATLLTHIYTTAGSYTARLTVNATNATAGAIAFTDTAPVAIAASSPSTNLVPNTDTAHWTSLGNGPDRSFFQGTTGITKSNIATLHVKWRFPTAYPVFASPAVADVNVPPLTGGPAVLTRMVFDGTYDGNVYGISDATGLPVWGPVCIVTSSTVQTSEASCNPSFPGNTNAQVDYGTIIGSPAVATIATPGGPSQRLFIGANATMDAIDTATGHVLWSFVAGRDPSYELESSPVVVGNTVYFGIDCNGECPKGGGIYALDANDGHMLWFFDPSAGQAFAGAPGQMSYDPTNNGPTTAKTCGGVWTSPTIDVSQGLLVASTANCQINPLPPYMEAVFALHTSDGSPVWQYQPRPIDALDMDYGATPNVFQLGNRRVVGAASKDGTYTLFDNTVGSPTLGTVIWSTKAALGGAFGGFYNSVTDGTKIYLSSAIGNVDGFAVTPAEENMRGREYALDARTGNVIWRQLAGPFNIGQNSAVPGVYLTGGLDHLLHAWDADNGAPLASFPLAGAASGTPVVAGNEVYIGAGTGATYRSFVGPSDPLGVTGVIFPHPIPIGEYGQGIYAFCLAADVTCPATPTATVPETPRAVLMPLVGGSILLVVAALWTPWRRRRVNARR